MRKILKLDISEIKDDPNKVFCDFIELAKKSGYTSDDIDFIFELCIKYGIENTLKHYVK